MGALAKLFPHTASQRAGHLGTPDVHGTKHHETPQRFRVQGLGPYVYGLGSKILCLALLLSKRLLRGLWFAVLCGDYSMALSVSKRVHIYSYY